MNGTTRRTRTIQAGAIVAALAIWAIVGYSRLINPILLPRVDDVFGKLIEIIVSGEVFHPLAVTVFEMVCAYLLAGTFGLAVGYVIGSSRFATKIFEPLFAGIFAIPIVIFLPLFILMFGIGPLSKILFGATYGFFPIVLNTIVGVSQVSAPLKVVGRSLGASRFQMFRRIIFPGALPVILIGIRIGFIICFLAIIGSEMIAGLGGLGSQIVRLGEGMNTSEMFAYIVFVVLLAAILNAILSTLQADPTRERRA